LILPLARGDGEDSSWSLPHDSLSCKILMTIGKKIRGTPKIVLPILGLPGVWPTCCEKTLGTLQVVYEFSPGRIFSSLWHDRSPSLSPNVLNPLSHRASQSRFVEFSMNFTERRFPPRVRMLQEKSTVPPKDLLFLLPLMDLASRVLAAFFL